MAVPTELLEILLLCYITILPLFNYSHPILFGKLQICVFSLCQTTEQYQRSIFPVVKNPKSNSRKSSLCVCCDNPTEGRP